MTQKENYRVLQGNCLDSLQSLESGSVNCCVTSPPYWGLRDYGTAIWKGGDVNCDHTISMPTKGNDPKRGTKYTRPEVASRGGDASACHLCGAKRVDSQLGMEETPEEYVANMVKVFSEVKRVLTKEGTLWLNLGDSYAGNCSRTSSGRAGMGKEREGIYSRSGKGLKSKDLVGIPWRVAFALQADGWYLRQDIIWHKPNPMPESVTDRCTKSHEYIFLLSKSPKYYYDHEVIKERCAESNIEDFKRRKTLDNKGKGKGTYEEARPDLSRGRDADMPDDFMRNKRSVWTVNTKPYPEAHFATFPKKLIRPCIHAGCPKGGVVLDPFGGSGTTAEVANELQRDAILCELNPEHCKLIEKRLSLTQMEMFV